jgi:hypothetical protein
MQAMCEALKILTQGQGALVLTELHLVYWTTAMVSLLPTSLTHLHVGHAWVHQVWCCC